MRSIVHQVQPLWPAVILSGRPISRARRHECPQPSFTLSLSSVVLCVDLSTRQNLRQASDIRLSLTAPQSALLLSSVYKSSDYVEHVQSKTVFGHTIEAPCRLWCQGHSLASLMSLMRKLQRQPSNKSHKTDDVGVLYKDGGVSLPT